MRRIAALLGLLLAVAVIIPTTFASADNPPPGRTTYGYVRLHMGHSGYLPSQDYFRYEPVFGSTQVLTQPLSIQANGPNKCTVTPSTSPQVVNYNSGGTGTLGHAGDSLGVRSGTDGTGTPCGRVNGSEKLVLQLGSALTGSTVPGNRKADYAELDIEGKQNASILATVFNGITPLGTVTLADSDFAGQDNGPDSGLSNNARLIIDPTAPSFAREEGASGNEFDRIELALATPGVGAFSLEGGSDGVTSTANPSAATDGAGPLGVELQTRDSIIRVVGDTDTALCQGDTYTEDRVTIEVLEGAGSGDCADPIALSVVRNGNTVDILKSVDATVKFKVTVDAWDPEPAVLPVPQSFVQPPTPEVAVEWCNGTQAAPVMTTGDFWCLISQESHIVATPAGQTGQYMQVTESFLLQGDATVRRK